MVKNLLQEFSKISSQNTNDDKLCDENFMKSYTIIQKDFGGKNIHLYNILRGQQIEKIT